MRRYRYEGFTVLEILIVIGILCFMLAMIATKIGSGGHASKSRATRALIQSIEMSAARYQADFRTLPPDTSIDAASIWRYLSKPVVDKSGKTHTFDLKIPSEHLIEYNDPVYGKSFKVVDSWNTPITFVGDPKNIRHNRDSCDISSAGPDKIFDTADDINNCKP
jgi:type II secretory pathway pseudopilin PulG